MRWVMQKVETNETTFYFSCESSLEKEQWIGAIGNGWMIQARRWSRGTLVIMMIDYQMFELSTIERLHQWIDQRV